jgi:hypothetical protein
MAGGIKFKDHHKELAVLLRKQPREVSVAIAARAALRVLPKIQKVERIRNFQRALVLPVFRATVISWSVAKYPAQEINAARAAAAAGAAADAWVVSGLAGPPRIEAGEAAAGLVAGAPLWPNASSRLPYSVPEWLWSLWQEMKADLHAAYEDWDVWTNWYEDRLAGNVRSEIRELAYVRIDPDLWDQGPAVVNAEIKRRIESLELQAESEPPSIEVLPPWSEPPRGEAKRAAQTSSVGSPNVSRVALERTLFTGFFSYTHRDAEVDPHIVEAFSSELEKRVDANLINAQFQVWRDKEKLRVGDHWNEEIERSIDSADVFVVMLTPKWISSDYCRKKFAAFHKIEAERNSGRYVIPIYGREIEGQARFLEPEQRELLDRLNQIQYKRAIPRTFAKLSNAEKIELIEDVADAIVGMLNRLRG